MKSKRPSWVEWMHAWPQKMIHAYREKRTEGLVYRLCNGERGVWHSDLERATIGRKCRRCSKILSSGDSGT